MAISLHKEKSTHRHYLPALAFFFSALCPAHLIAASSALQRAEGYWELDPASDEDVGDFRCDVSPLQITIDAAKLRYSSFSDGVAEKADILEVGNTFFWIRYDDEERLDDDGRPLEWAFVLFDEDRFYWVRRDWVATGEGARTAMRRRCPPPDLVSSISHIDKDAL